MCNFIFIPNKINDSENLFLGGGFNHADYGSGGGDDDK
jgi:hypothetical protein